MTPRPSSTVGHVIPAGSEGVAAGADGAEVLIVGPLCGPRHLPAALAGALSRTVSNTPLSVAKSAASASVTSGL
jgi:hypothetical protein